MCPVDFDKMKQKAVSRGAGGWRPKPGQNVIRFLPFASRYFHEAVDMFCYDYRAHYFKADGIETEVFRCPRDLGQFCIACEFAGRYKESGDALLKRAADQIKAGQAYLANILDINAPQDGVQAYEFGWMIYKQLFPYAQDANWGDIMNVADTHCYVITLNLPGQGTNRSGYNEYLVGPDPRRTTVASLLPQGWETKIDELESRIPPTLEENRARGLLHILGFPGAKTPEGPGTVDGRPIYPHTQTPYGSPPPAAAVPVAVPVAVGVPHLPAAHGAVPPVTPAGVGHGPPLAAPVAVAAAPAYTPPPAATPQPVPVASPPNAGLWAAPGAAAGVATVQPPTAAPTQPAAPVAAMVEPTGYPYAKGRTVPGGAPNCFGDFNPHNHPCDTYSGGAECTFKEKCMLRTMDIDK